LNSSNLIPLASRTTEEQRAIQKKGGRSKSPKKSVSAKLRWLRERKINDESANKLIEMYDNKEITHIDLLAFYQKWQSKANTIQEAVMIGRLIMDWSKQVHGTEAINTQVNIQNNTEINVDEHLYAVYNEGLKRDKQLLKKRVKKKS